MIIIKSITVYCVRKCKSPRKIVQLQKIGLSQSHVYIKTKNYYLLNCQEHISKFSHEMKFLLASFTVFSHIIIFGY